MGLCSASSRLGRFGTAIVSYRGKMTILSGATFFPRNNKRATSANCVSNIGILSIRVGSRVVCRCLRDSIATNGGIRYGLS